MPRRASWVLLAATGLSLLPAATAADERDLTFFESKIRPILATHCYECHSQQANKSKGGLTLDTRAGIRKGGDRGPAVVPGKPEESLLLTALRHEQDDLKMPPRGRLPAAVIADLEEWIRRGAADPRNAAKRAVVSSDWDGVLRERRRWWSLQPVRKPALPVVRAASWSEHPVDRFILARLEAAGLRPAAEADARTLIRRLYLILIGLPPTAEEVERYLAAANAKPQAATEELVDRLLESPHFGERWARHWLDVVRFTETHGNEWNYEVHHAWRYRDYLIRAFNDDLPYDQFVREHIAGDLLPPRWNRGEQFNEAVIGTAFYRFGEVNHDDCIEFRQIGYDLADNQIDTLTKAFQATTVACARCHDHKLDAVSMRDYYALLGILRSSRLVSHTIDAPEANAPIKKQLRGLKRDIRIELAELWRREADDLGRYLLAAQSKLDGRTGASQLAVGLDPARVDALAKLLKAEKRSSDDLLYPWQALRENQWTKEHLWLNEKRRERERLAREPEAFVELDLNGWDRDGQGLADGPTTAADITVATTGDAAVGGVYPPGVYTHLLSQRLNGTLRSGSLPDKKYLSVQVLGQKTSAVRLVSNNCQLNYKNYQALTKDQFAWQRLTIPADHKSLHTYAEVMTKFNNPKFPDQLGTLGGDKANARVPWDAAALDPDSFFGITRAVAHDCDELPSPDLRPGLRFLRFNVSSEANTAEAYRGIAVAAVRALGEGSASDVDAHWIDWLLRHGLLTNQAKATPRLQELVSTYRAAEAQLALPRIVPSLAEGGPGEDQPLLARGDVKRPGAPIPRGFLEVLDQPRFELEPQSSGRRMLAERIASADNPLTARVMVNRLWHHLFGSGLVRTVDDFGHVGDLPSHPELLDYLAARFVEEGWSIKKMLRLLVLSKTFRQASVPSEAAREADPENRLLHHYAARRLEAEAIRDSILAASGRLDRTQFGPSIHPFRDKPNADRRLFPGPLDGNGRRSIYIKVNLMEAPPFLGVFNFPGGKVTQGRRDATNVPAQALALLNDPFVLQQADFWAEKLIARRESVVQRIDQLFAVALNRPPTGEERERFGRALGDFARIHSVNSDAVLTSRPVWADMAQAMFNLKEFIYVR